MAFSTFVVDALLMNLVNEFIRDEISKEDLAYGLGRYEPDEIHEAVYLAGIQTCLNNLDQLSPDDDTFKDELYAFANNLFNKK